MTVKELWALSRTQLVDKATGAIIISEHLLGDIGNETVKWIEPQDGRIAFETYEREIG